MYVSDLVSPPPVSLPLGESCPDCGKVFSTRSNLLRHQRLHCPAIRARVYRQNPPHPPPSSGQGGTGSGYFPAQPSPSGGQDGTDGSGPGSPSGGSDNGTGGNYSDSPGDNRRNVDSPVLPSDLAPHGFEESETGFRGRLKTYRLQSEAPSHLPIPDFLVILFQDIVTLMHRVIHHVPNFKTNLWLECEFVNVHEQTCRRAFKTRNVPVLRSTDLEQLCGDLFQKLVDEHEACEMKGSGWAFVRVLDMEIRINVYRPLGGNSFIPLPLAISRKKAVVNVVNMTDHRCFEYAVLSRFLENPNHSQVRPSMITPEVRRRANLDFSDLEFPVRFDQINKFEKKNSVSVNVYGVDFVRSRKKKGFYEDVIYPLRIAAEEEQYPDHFDLLFLTDDEKTHYALITNFERLVRSQVTKRCNRIYVCKRCFAHFDDQPNKLQLSGARRLEEHRRYCKEHTPLRTDLAEKKKIRFERHERSQRSRFTIYADFECALQPFEPGRQEGLSATIPPPDWDPASIRGDMPHNHHRGAAADAGGVDSANVKTRKIHKPYAYAYYILDSHDNHRTSDQSNNGNTFSTLRFYRGPNAARRFMESIRDDIRHIGDLLYQQRNLQAQLTAAEEEEFQRATLCYICKRPFIDGEKVRDHEHTAPFRYRGAAHRHCNLRHMEQNTVNCYFHNLSNYDAHFVVRELGIDKGDVRVLANNEEKFISFSKHFNYPGAGRRNSMGVRFLDSYRFLSRGLAYLASILPVDKLCKIKKYFQDNEQFELVRRKGVFPYEYVTSTDVLEENVLPPAEAFRDSLRQEDITPEEYAHAKRVWEVFQCASLGDYADVYLKTDVLLLADVFESFRDMCLHHYGLDPAHWITLPSYAWDVMLFKTDVTLDTLQDVEQYLFFEKGIRGGLAQCVTRHVIAENKHTRGDCVERPDDSYIMYYDSNNLYGLSMIQHLPYGDFEWLSREEIDSLNIRDVKEDADVGYVLEVDLEYPQDPNIHDKHRDLPFCPEVRQAPRDQLPYPDDVLQNFGVGKSKKLMVTLYDKNAYVIHYRSLQQAMDNGLRVRYIHRVLRFKQAAWMKPYVVMNTELRRQAKNKFEVELFKLMVNAVYGMSLQNVRKHVNICIATNRKSYTKYVAKSNFSDRTWYSEDLVMLNMMKTRVILDKPVYVGMAILDHSKWWMYGFHYKMQERYGLGRIRLIYMDTDSLVYKILSPDVYRDMLNHLEDFDTSNYPRDHICYDETNARVLGKFKDEAGGVTIREFIGLMAKLYCFVFYRGDDDDLPSPPPVKRAKGVNRAVVDKGLTVDDYRRCLQQHTVKLTENDRFQSRHHIMYTVRVAKRSLAPYDDKRYVIPEDGGVNTLPWGHYAIPSPQLASSSSPSSEMDEDDV